MEWIRLLKAWAVVGCLVVLQALLPYPNGGVPVREQTYKNDLVVYETTHYQ